MLNPAYAEASRFLHERLSAALRARPTASRRPDGRREYYAFRVRQETTTDLTPTQIHEIGLAEVARIRAEMEKVARRRRASPSREAFIPDLRTNPIYYAKTPEAADGGDGARRTSRSTARCRACSARCRGFPTASAKSRPRSPKGTTTAYYGQGSPESGIAGTYYVNTSKLDQRPLWEIPALSLHEAVPGHHHQIALQQELDDRRRSAGTSTSFTAFTEGWGLYSESLGEEMGLYDTPAKRMGRADLPDVARGPAGGRHRHPRQGLGQGAGGRFHDARIRRLPTPISRPR